MNELNHNQNINLSLAFLASPLAVSGMKTQLKCRMEINFILETLEIQCVLRLTIPPGQRSGEESFLCGCIHLWNGLMLVHHLNESRMFMMDASLPKIWWEEFSKIGERTKKRKYVYYDMIDQSCLDFIYTLFSFLSSFYTSSPLCPSLHIRLPCPLSFFQ